jgi:hypothetical protein
MDSTSDPNSDAVPEPSTTDGRDEPAPTEPEEPSADSGQPEDSAAQPGERMPDASTLVAMAAMHMGTTDLLHVLLTVFDAHAWRSMGLVADHTGEARKDMPAAQTAIDCLAFVLSKVESTLDEGEKRDVNRRLMDLRMNYVAKLREG